MDRGIIVLRILSHKNREEDVCGNRDESPSGKSPTPLGVWLLEVKLVSYAESCCLVRPPGYSNYRKLTAVKNPMICFIKTSRSWDFIPLYISLVYQLSDDKVTLKQTPRDRSTTSSEVYYCRF